MQACKFWRTTKGGAAAKSQHVQLWGGNGWMRSAHAGQRARTWLTHCSSMHAHSSAPYGVHSCLTVAPAMCMAEKCISCTANPRRAYCLEAPLPSSWGLKAGCGRTRSTCMTVQAFRISPGQVRGHHCLCWCGTERVVNHGPLRPRTMHFEGGKCTSEAIGGCSWRTAGSRATQEADIQNAPKMSYSSLLRGLCPTACRGPDVEQNSKSRFGPPAARCRPEAWKNLSFKVFRVKISTDVTCDFFAGMPIGRMSFPQFQLLGHQGMQHCLVTML